MIIWNIIMILVGIIVLLADFNTCVYRKFTELMGIGWGVFSIFLILFGAVPGLSDWSLLMGHKGALLIFILFIFMIINAFLVCIRISQLSMKNQELAMQVSLLNQENERILNELEQLTGKSKTKL